MRGLVPTPKIAFKIFDIPASRARFQARPSERMNPSTVVV